MENRDLLEKIHRDNKAINRNIQSLINIGLIGLMGKIEQEARKSDDKAGKAIARIGLFIIMISEILLFVGDIVDYRKEKRLL